MPTFPTYSGELPSRLNPLNLRHYFLLAYWLYFRPTALNCYLYQADPELYRVGPGLGIFRTLANPAHRNLYLVGVGITLIASWITSVLSVTVVLLVNSIQGTAPEWSDMAVMVFVTFVVFVVLGVVLGVIRGVAEGVAFAVAGGVFLGAAGGVFLGAGGGVFLGAALGVVFAMSRGAAFIMAFLMALGVVLFASYGVAEGVAFAVVFAVWVLRLPTYALQGGRLLHFPCPGKHPLWWDELAVLPFLNTQVAISQA